MGSMTQEEAAAEIERMDAERAAAYEARRAAITPHVRKPNDRSKLSRHAAASPHNRTPIGAEITGTYCGADITTEDLDRRDATSWFRKAPAEVTERGVCVDCLRIAGVSS